MSETPTPAQDLEALDRVAELLDRHGPAEDGTVRELNALRAEIEEAQGRHCELAEAFNAVRPPFVEETLPALGLAIVRAAVAVGARIIFPSPDSPETPERPSAADTAPRIDTAVDERADWEKLLDGDVPEPTAREKILAEVATAYAKVTPLQWGTVQANIEAACKLAANGLTDHERRRNVIDATSVLVLVVERMDGDL